MLWKATGLLSNVMTAPLPSSTFIEGINAQAPIVQVCDRSVLDPKVSSLLTSSNNINALGLSSTVMRNARQTPSFVAQQSSSSFVRQAVQAVGPSVVRIDVEREVTPMMAMLNDNFHEGDTIRVAGTGFVVGEDGYILTNAHVVDNARKVTFQLSTGRTFKASVVELDEFTDLAVLKADLTQEPGLKLPVAPLGDSSTLQAGDWVIAVGCPVGLDFTVTLGVVSSPRRSALEVGALHLKGSYIQTDAALNSGNSGGPLVNDRGEVVGINTMVRTNTEAIGFAIPMNRARAVYNVLKEGRKPNHAYFGIDIHTVTPDVAKINNEDPNASHIPVTSGALVLRVKPGSPAEVAGLRRNDVIVKVNDEVVRSADEAEARLDACKPGHVSTLVVTRGESGAQHILSVIPSDMHQILQERKRMLAAVPSTVKPAPSR